MSPDHKSKLRSSPQMFNGLLPFDKISIRPDIVAGITLAALGIPEVMGYTKIIGTPVITGLYTLFLPVLIYALFGSSRHLVVSADSATAAIVAAGLIDLIGANRIFDSRHACLAAYNSEMSAGSPLAP